MSANNQPLDTDPEAELVLVELIRRQSPVERLQKMAEQSDRVQQQCKAAIRRRYPEYSEDDVRIKLIELNYGEDLATSVRVWRESGQ